MRKNKAKKRDEVIEVTRKDYDRELAQGVDPDHALRPGRHVFQPARRVIPPEAFESRSVKIRVNIYLDGDIVQFFKKRADAPNAAPYQTQINAALRTFLDDAGAEPDATALLHNERFLDALEARLRQRRERKKRRVVA